MVAAGGLQAEERRMINGQRKNGSGCAIDNIRDRAKEALEENSERHNAGD